MSRFFEVIFWVEDSQRNANPLNYQVYPTVKKKRGFHKLKASAYPESCISPDDWYIGFTE